MKKFSKEEIIIQFNNIHNNQYDYSLFTEYKGTLQKINIICNKHGIFNQLIKNHKKGIGCPKCSKEKQSKTLSLSKTDFINKSDKIHHNKYDYKLVKYKNNQTKIKIICPNYSSQ